MQYIYLFAWSGNNNNVEHTPYSTIFINIERDPVLRVFDVE